MRALIAAWFGVAIASATLSLHAADARRVGCFFSGAFPERATQFCNAVRAGLRERGWKDQGELFFVITNEWPDRLPGAARDFVKRNVEVIVANDRWAAEALRDATSSIPIVATGLWDIDRNRPGPSPGMPVGNVTGVSKMLDPAAVAKAFPLVRMIGPRVERLGVLVEPNDQWITSAVRSQWEAAARSAGLAIRWLATSPQEAEFGKTLAAARDEVDAVLVASLFLDSPQSMNGASKRYGVPFIGSFKWSEPGALMMLVARDDSVYRQAAGFVDRILRGEKIGSLHVERAADFRLVLDLRVAKALGLDLDRRLVEIASERVQ